MPAKTGKWSRRCGQCGRLLPKTNDIGRTTRSDKRYCDLTCRIAHLRLQRRIDAAVAAALAERTA